MANLKLCIYALGALMFIALLASLASQEYLLAGASLISVFMCYFYYGAVQSASESHDLMCEAQKDEVIADEVMKKMWQEEEMAAKHAEILIANFRQKGLKNLIEHFLKFTISRIDELENEWYLIRYCPYDHPGLQVVSFAKEQTMFITIAENVQYITEHLKTSDDIEKIDDVISKIAHL